MANALNREPNLDVPEPATLLAMLGGIGSLGGYLRITDFTDWGRIPRIRRGKIRGIWVTLISRIGEGFHG